MGAPRKDDPDSTVVPFPIDRKRRGRRVMLGWLARRWMVWALLGLSKGFMALAGKLMRR